ncbi:NAD(P)-dependent oxidoreductase [Jannaschia sp. LMIT008]|uniref:NAD(P)-dependent oxidoreductase n=1 Tax=Jannaschia maritima TaxID=3032585 RepID=UPI0028110924|nr:NAD(P)-dependent oxidoreductase [Jannaschia sp. LMIT008]
MKTVLILKPLRPAGLDLFAARSDLRVVRIDAPTRDDIARHLPDAHAVCIKNTPLPADLLDAAPDLAVVSKHGVGLDNLPMDALTARRIPVAWIGDANAGAVAEHAMLLMLALARRLPQYQARARAGGYIVDPDWPTFDLRGRRLLLVGLGRIGTRVADLARAFGMRVTAFDPAAPDHAGVARAPTLADGLSRADVVSLHAPYTPATDGLIDADALAAMPPGGWVVNTARGELIDEAALIAALDSGHLAGAGLDVLRREPPDPADPLLSHPRVIATPHTAALTEDTAEAMSRLTAQNALNGLDGRLDPALLANPEVLP